jgi:hypothetical protein
MSHVGAVVLTLGERTTSRALSSLEAQTLLVEQVGRLAGVWGAGVSLERAA